MSECERVQIAVEMLLRGRGAGPAADADPHVAGCEACRRYAEFAGASAVDLRARALRRARNVDPVAVRDRATASARRLRRALATVLVGDLIGSAAVLVFLGPGWAAAMLAAGLVPLVAAYLDHDIRHRALLRAASGEGDLFEAVRADLRAATSRLRWAAPCLVIVGLALAVETATRLAGASDLAVVVRSLGILFDLGFVAFGVWSFTRIPAMRRELDDLGTAADA